MLTYCTYCSALKARSKDPLPAILLYRSERITQVFESAKSEDVLFIILSGKYGLVDAAQKIEEYDHLLASSEVSQHSDLIAGQIKKKNISQIVFFMNTLTRDPDLKPYLDCLVQACEKTGVSLRIKEDDYID